MAATRGKQLKGATNARGLGVGGELTVGVASDVCEGLTAAADNTWVCRVRYTMMMVT